MEKEYKIAIIGLGYVGLPLAIAFSKYYKVVGYDIGVDRVAELNEEIDRNLDISVSTNSNLIFSNDESDLEDSSIYIITVPTPVDSKNTPDLSFLKSASKLVAKYLEKGDLVIYESTVYPGVTEDVCVPILSSISGLSYNYEFFCGYSPERISPGDKKYNLQNVIKVTSGSTENTATLVDELYNKIIKAGTYKAPSIKVAEAAKVIENTQRDVNIALMNELAMMFDKMGIDTEQVLSAAKSKWNFLDFRPGLVGGHCIGVDPYYLLHKSEEMGYKPTLLHSSRNINNSVAGFIVDKTIKLMIAADKIVKAGKVLILGYTFKEDCSDTRNTKVEDIIQGLEAFSLNVSVYDPYVEVMSHSNFIKNPFDGDMKYDVIIVAVSHQEFIHYSTCDFEGLSKGKMLLLDIKGIYTESSWKF